MKHGHGPPLGAVARPGERHELVTVDVGVVGEDHAADLVLRGVGDLPGQRRMLRGLVAVEHAVGIVLLRLLPQHDHRRPLHRQHRGRGGIGGSARGGSDAVVVVVLGGRGDAIPREHEREVEPSRSSRRERGEVGAQCERDRPPPALGVGGADQFAGVAFGRPQLRVERHRERLKETIGPARIAGGAIPGADGGQPDAGELFRDPPSCLIDALRAGAAPLAIGAREPLDRLPQAGPQRLLRVGSVGHGLRRVRHLGGGRRSGKQHRRGRGAEEATEEIVRWRASGHHGWFPAGSHGDGGPSGPSRLLF